MSLSLGVWLCACRTETSNNTVAADTDADAGQVDRVDGARDAGRTGSASDDAAANVRDSDAASQAIDDYADAFCEFARSCCAEAGFALAPLVDCEAEAVRQFNFLQGAVQGSVLLVEPAYSQCVQNVRDAVQTCDIADAFTRSCIQAFQGSVPLGGTCRKANDCRSAAGPVACIKVPTDADPEAEFGECHQLERASEGEDCIDDGGEDYLGVTLTDGTRSSIDDVPKAYCDTRDGLWCLGVCMKHLEEGQMCNFEGCAPGLYCDATCRPELEDNAPCEDSFACRSGLLCREGVCRAPTLGDTEICEGDFD